MAADAPLLMLARLLESGRFSDLKFTCNGEEYNVHKYIVCEHSAVLKAAVMGQFEEATTAVVRMDEFEPVTVDRMVRFMYTGDYADPETGEISKKEISTASSAAGPQGGNAEETQRSNADQERVGEIILRSLFDLLPFLILRLGYSEEASKSADSQPLKPKTAHNCLVEHIWVVIIADYYALEPLISHANSKIQKLLGKIEKGNEWFTYLPPAIGVATQSNSNDELWSNLASAVATHMEALLECDPFLALDYPMKFSNEILRKRVEKRRKSQKLLAQNKMLTTRTESLEKCLADFAVASRDGSTPCTVCGYQHRIVW